MQFSESEVRFLLQSFPAESATGNRPLKPAVDMRALGCPAATFNRILESRAQQLGRKFAEFRNTGRAAVQVTSTLEQELTAMKLF